MTNLRRYLLSSLAALALLCGSALAQPRVDSDEPVLLSADNLVYDEANSTVTASGNVELAQGDRILIADAVSFNQRSNVVTATGNVALLDPTGDIYFSDYVELTKDLKDGFVRNARALLADNSRLAANEAERVDGRYMQMNRAVYSPCQLCEKDPTRAPLWQMKAAQVTHDQESKDIVYRDAYLEFYGIPVAYTPYFSHPDPSVKRRSGFLTPSFGYTSALGAFARGYYYWDIAPQTDATFELGYATEHGPLIGGEFRHRFEKGRVQIRGSATQGDVEKLERGILVTDQNVFRGHLFADGRYDINDNWRSGIDLALTSDDTYLRNYRYSTEDILRNRAFVEGFFRRNYAAINSYYFQDLRRGQLEEQPFVLPLIEYSALGEPNGLLGGRWSFDTNFLAITRSPGQDVQRAAAEAGWQRRFIAPIGLLTSVDASVRGDLYFVQDRDLPTASSTGFYLAQSSQVGRSAVDDTEARIFPQISTVTSYPVSRPVGNASAVIEPLVGLRLAPRLSKNSDVPNEDSRDLELDITNLFKPNRFPGSDRIEDGSRVTYGVRSGVYWPAGGYVSLFLGQSYRFLDASNLPTGSGLSKDWSDIVGQVQASPGRYVDLDYRFRYGSSGEFNQKHEFTIAAGVPQFSVSANYLFINGGEGTGLRDRNQLTLGLTSQLTQNWTVGAVSQNNLGSDAGLITGGLSLTYHDECFIFGVAATRDLTSQPGAEPETAVIFTVGLKNLGTFSSPINTTGLTRGTRQR